MHRKLMIILTLLCGVGGAVLRGLELAFAFEPGTSLLAPWHAYSVSLIVLSFVFAAAAIFLTLRNKKPESEPVSALWLAAELAAALMLAASGALSFSPDPSATMLARAVYGIMAIVSAGCVAALALAVRNRRLTATSGFGFIATVPVFWSCYGLCLDFWGHSGISTRSAYMYGMFALIFLTLALFSAAGFIFRDAKRKRGSLYCLLGIFFAVVTLGGSLLARIAFAPPPSLLADIAVLPTDSMLRLGFVVLHLLCLYQAIEKGRFAFEPAKKAPVIMEPSDIPAYEALGDELEAELSRLEGGFETEFDSDDTEQITDNDG